MRKLAKTHSKKLAALMVGLILTVSMAFSPPTAKCVDRFCDTCQLTCQRDYVQVIENCISDGGSLLVCQMRNSSWMYNCGVVTCPVCTWYENY